MYGFTPDPASYKDPSGFTYYISGKICRQVNKRYKNHYDLFKKSGLCDLLQKKGFLIDHEELHENLLNSKDWYLTLMPENISFWSYPYEWCFAQLKDAALLTLEIVKLSVDRAMILKDATPFNIQFYKGKPTFIDTLSFEKYDETVPWVAYRQFCESFLFPLWLSHYHKMNFQNLFSIYPDGIPAAITSKLLPSKSLLNPGVWMHVQLPVIMSKKNRAEKNMKPFSKIKLLHLVSHLQSIISQLDNNSKTTWSHYYTEMVEYSDYIIQKIKIVHEVLRQTSGNKVLDLGANEGQFSLMAAENNFEVIAVDSDEQCINNLYNKIKQQNISSVLPLCIDIANPSSASGFSGNERISFNERIHADTVLALALVHHLVIGKNIPLPMVAGYFSSLASQLIIEFVPKDDEKTKILLQNREDIFPDYSMEQFEIIFQKFFHIELKEKIAGSGRIIYLMKRLVQS